MLFRSTRINISQQSLRGCAKIVVYQGIAATCSDGLTIGYLPEIVDTNALLVSGNHICAVFNLRLFKGNTDQLYLTKSAEMTCRISPVKSFRLYCMTRAQSDWMYHFYEKDQGLRPEHLDFYEVPVMDFQVRDLLEMDMPLAIDFGTTNTTAGIYLDSSYLERLEGDPAQECLKENDVNYVTYVKEEDKETPLLPSVVGVLDISKDKVQYVFGYEADRLFHSSYIDEGF